MLKLLELSRSVQNTNQKTKRLHCREVQVASLYKQFVAEREGAEVFETEFGFATYTLEPGKHLYFSEFFVVEHKRNTRAALHIWLHVQKVAQAYNCKFILGSVDITTANWQLSATLMQKCQFEAYHTEGNLIYFRKVLLGDING